jgi:hypothetical protein
MMNLPFSQASHGLPIGRREILGKLAFAGLALAASATPAKAFFVRRTPVSVDLSDLPDEWVQRHGAVLPQYASYLASLKLTRVTPRQVIDAHVKKHGAVWNALPPKSLWAYMGPTLKVVDRMAAELDMPVREVVSVYRSPAYNARCRGAKSNSWHQSNVAVDVKFPVRASTVTSLARQLRGQGVFRGGVGGYGGFTHVDTRGTNVDW